MNFKFVSQGITKNLKWVFSTEVVLIKHKGKIISDKDGNRRHMQWTSKKYQTVHNISIIT